MRGTSYKAPLTLSFIYKVNGMTKDIFQDVVGEIPIMIKVFTFSRLNSIIY